MFSQNRQHRRRDVQQLLNQIAQMTDPELTPVCQESRQQIRRSRVLPVLLTPWENGGPVVDDSVYALTKDVSEQGMALVLQSPYRIKTAVIGLVTPSADIPGADIEPSFMLGEARQNVPLGGGYWQLGLELTELVLVGEHPRLEPLLLLAKVVSKVTCANLLQKGNMY